MQREVIYRLPPYLQKELLDRMLSSGFSEYKELEKWLTGLGYKTSKSALHRLGLKFEVYLSRGDAPSRLQILFERLGYRKSGQSAPN